MNTVATRPGAIGRDVRYLRPDASRPLPRRRSRRGWRRVAVAALRSLLAVALILAAREGGRWLLRSSAFEVRSVTVEGCRQADPEEIRTLVRRAGGRNILEVDLAEVRALAESHPWVLRAEVRRRFPGTLGVAVTERTPAGVALVGGRALLADAEGVCLAECGTVAEDCDYPVLTGLDGFDAEARAARIAAGIASVRALGTIAPRLAGRISEVDLSRDDRVALLPEDGAPIYLSTEDYGRNVANYLSVENEINRRFERLDYVDLRFRGRIAVMPAAAPAGTGAAAGGGTRR